MPSPAGFETPFSSNPERVGRDGFLNLRFEHRSGKTALTQCRFRLPLQALAPSELSDGTAYLMLLNPTGGIVGGDSLFTQIVLGANTRACLTTPSATRVYRTLNSAAAQKTFIMIGENSSLEYLPDHVIPHRGSILQQSVRVEMGPGGSGIFWDALAAGRVARGERWDFREVDSRFAIYLRGRPLFLNRTRIRPAEVDPTRLGITDGFDYLATLVIVADQSNDWAKLVAVIHAELAAMPEIRAGVSALTSHGCVLKLLAHTASGMSRAQTTLWSCARREVLGSDAADLRKY